MVATNNGTVTINGSTATYEPTQDWNGTDTFTYLANDGTEDSNDYSNHYSQCSQ